jgi:hypothetical protein
VPKYLLGISNKFEANNISKYAPDKSGVPKLIEYAFKKFRIYRNLKLV